MAPRKDDTPSVATYADHEVITPPHAMRKAVSVTASADDDPIARAEAALVQLSSEFSDLDAGGMRAPGSGPSGRQAVGFTDKTREALFRSIHDIKGEAATFGYPEVAGVAESLCRLIEHTPGSARIPIALLDQHVDAVRAIIREQRAPTSPKWPRALTRRLREVTDDFLRRENEFRPDYLASIFSPPLAPEPSGS